MKAKYFAIPPNHSLNYDGSVSRDNLPCMAQFYGYSSRKAMRAAMSPELFSAMERAYNELKYTTAKKVFATKKLAAGYCADNGLILAYRNKRGVYNVSFS